MLLQKIISASVIGCILVSPLTAWGILVPEPIPYMYEGAEPDNESTITEPYPIVSYQVDENIKEVVELEYELLNGDPVDLSKVYLTGLDAVFFEISPVNGEISFVQAPDYENPLDAGQETDGETENNIYFVGVRFAESIYVAGIDLEVEVRDVVEVVDPVLTTQGLSTTEVQLAVDEGQVFVGTSTASELSGESITSITISGGQDAALFELQTENATTVEILFKNAPEYELALDADGDNMYRVHIKAIDEDGQSVTQELVITVNDVLGDPVFDLVGGVNTYENTTEDLVTIVASDQQEITFSVVSGLEDGSLFELASTTATTTVLKLINAVDFEIPTDENIDNTYKVYVQAVDSLNNKSFQQVSVEVLGVNDNSPVLQQLGAADSGEVAMLDNSQLVVDLVATDADLPGDTLVLSVSTSSPDGALFEISNSQLQFIQNPAVGVYEVTVGVSDGSISDEQTIGVTVLDSQVNYAPAISNSNGTTTVELDLEEGYVGLVADLDAVDLNGDSFVWSIEGDDAAWFTMDETQGVLALASTTDFETPEDVNNDGVYVVSAVVTDVRAGNDHASSTQTYMVTITDVEERPNFSTTTATFAENSTGEVIMVTITDPQMDLASTTQTVTADSQFFTSTITSSGTMITIHASSSFDHELPQDENMDNNYELIFEASDVLGNIRTEVITITIENVEEFVPTILNNQSATSTHISVEEGVGDVAVIEGEDGDKDELVFSITGGADQNLFIVGTSTGQLVFSTTTVFSAPSDVNGDNVYEVEVAITDNKNTQCNACTVQELSEADDVQLWYVTVEEKKVVSVVNSSGGSSGGSRYVCKDKNALNYSSRGKPDSSLCKYPKREEEKEEKEEEREEQVGVVIEDQANEAKKESEPELENRVTGSVTNTNSEENTSFVVASARTETEGEEGVTVENSEEVGNEEEQAIEDVRPSQAANILGALTEKDSGDTQGTPWPLVGLGLLVLLVGVWARMFMKPRA